MLTLGVNTNCRARHPAIPLLSASAGRRQGRRGSEGVINAGPGQDPALADDQTLLAISIYRRLAEGSFEAYGRVDRQRWTTDAHDSRLTDQSSINRITAEFRLG